METESSVLPTIDVENENQIEYASHVHPFTLCEIDHNYIYCSVCLERCLDGRMYGCNQCDLFIHESCTKIEIPQEIDHYFHPHPLRLVVKEKKHFDSPCMACDDDSSPGLMFECRDCEFYMDVKCALLPTKLKQDHACSIDHIQHFRHPHPLILCDDKKKYEKKLCSGCGGGLCFSYDTLFLSEGSESIYGCLHLRCEFFLHERCVLPTTIDVENENQIEYASHVHPFTLCEIDHKYIDCAVCLERTLGGRIYGCNQCGLFIHESCIKIEIPQEIDHYFHPHPLRLSMKEDKKYWVFECRDCDFYMDVKTALLPTKLKQDGCTIDHIQHLHHFHPLILCDDKKKYEKELCSGCGGGLSTRPCFSYDTSLLSEGSESIYWCLHPMCTFFLHERCAQLPQEIDNPFHPGHSLEMIRSFSKTKCQGCDRPSVNDHTYQCPDSCKFILGVECAFLPPPILKFESHNHLLTLFPSINPLLSCRICNKKCDSSNIFRCIDCDYNLHLHCGPLPCSIKDNCHIDPLELMSAFVEDGYEDDTVYCDVCEQPRDPDQCVYYCKDCNFFAELKCVEAEVLRSLNGERGNVKLRTANKTRIEVGAKLISNVITDTVETDSDNETDDIGARYLEVEELDENFLSANYYIDEEIHQLIEIFEKSGVQLLPSAFIPQRGNEALCAQLERDVESRVNELQGSHRSIFYYSSDKESYIGDNAIAEPYTNEFEQLMRNLDLYYASDELIKMFFRKDINIVRIGEHKVLKHSASVLKGLLHKYGDFTAKSKLSQKLKAIFLRLFCEVIRTMCLTNVREVDQQILWKWCKSLDLVHHAGFEIEFAIDQLYKVVHAFFGMKSRSSYSEMKSRVDIFSNEIEEDKAKLEEKKRQLVALKLDIEERKYGIEYESSPVLKKCFNYVSELKWKKAWDGSPIMFR